MSLAQALLVPGMGGGIIYSLQDLLTTDRAAGAVNGTAPDPGPGGLRVVTDTTSKLSITGGKIVVAGAAGAGDPGLWYSSLTRALGVVLLVDVNYTSGIWGAGFDSNQAGSSDNASFYANGNSLVSSNGGVDYTVATLAASTTYTLAISLRAVGSFLLIKGGAFTNWTLLAVRVNGNTATLFPALWASTAGITTYDNIRIPQSLFIPAPVAYDTFTRADGALGSTETAGPDAQVIPARAWTGATYTISTNKAIVTPTLGADVIVNGAFAADTDWNKGAGWAIAAGVAAATTASSDLTATVAPLTVGAWYSVTYTVGSFSLGTVQAVVGGVALPTHAANGTFTEIARAGTTAFVIRGAGFTGTVDNVICKPLTLSELFASLSGGVNDVLIDLAVTLSAALAGLPAGIVMNLDSAASPANFVIAYLDSNGNGKLDKCVAGVYTSVVSAAVTYSAGAVLRVMKNGTSYRLFYNSAAVGSAGTISDAGIISNTLCGLFGVSASNSVDNFTAWPVGTSGEYKVLDGF